MRASGILLPITSLPSAYGIGTFSKEAYAFVDFLEKAGQKYWQVLPFGSTGYGDSPYQSFSTFAGNPYFVDLETLISKGLLKKEECDAADFGTCPQHVEYEKIYFSRFDLLRKAYDRFKTWNLTEFLEFCKEQEAWLQDYSMFMAIKNHFNDCGIDEWEHDIRVRTPEALLYYENLLADDIQFYKFIQFEFFTQWSRLKQYANDKGIKIIGDIPIYVAYDSADAWANKELFQFDEQGKPIAVAGCPPDSFAATGQLWGNPLYNWDYHKQTGYQWWIKRIAFCFQLYDVVRVDHFRGFDEYYSIPYGAKDAVNGHWEQGPGLDIFTHIKEALGDVSIIAEDLGFLTDRSRKLVADCGYPGMKIIQFAFDSREESDYLPHNYNKNCVVYTGTHDNDTVVGWYENLLEQDQEYAREYLNGIAVDPEHIAWDFIKLTLASVADLAIIPMQDYLGLGSKARINTPSTLGGNWIWRMEQNSIQPDLAEKIYRVTKLYGRLGDK
ncbi:4-alpha-glucanotransferase [Anaerosporobacter faecicola]|uniref:4-alpha-glucanotransferase n=1 Tax=Anaerosporobacter faecicola TaxID=2718714 RepID=UPI00143A06CC|nr:4-alpha-glucanotransferase [Anaerosporobacter faecicola]